MFGPVGGRTLKLQHWCLYWNRFFCDHVCLLNCSTIKAAHCGQAAFISGNNNFLTIVTIVLQETIPLNPNEYLQFFLKVGHNLVI